MAASPTQRRPDLDQLYCINEDGSRNTIHTADVRGRYQVRKKLIWTILIAIYLALPWIEIAGRPAVLLDIPARHFFLFGHSFNAQDFYLAFFVLTGIGFTLFVVSALFGRIWCGYGCPHTVFLEGVYRRVERWIEGSAPQRKRLAESGWTVDKVLRRGSKWAIFLAISLVLSHTMLAYFMGIDEVLAATTQSPSNHATAFTFIVVFTLIIYGNFAWFREQLCIVICPYGRLQGVLYDDDTINVGYDQTRGEPRGKYHAETRGDCIDCYRCVAVCPTGIDIRNGTQLECVGCANCIDACDEVMAKLGQEPGLVRYDSQRGFETGKRRMLRPRLWLYAALCLVGLSVFTVFASTRTAFEVKVIRQPGSAYTLLGDDVRNSFFVHVFNKRDEPIEFSIVPRASDGTTFVPPRLDVVLDPLSNRRLPLFVTTPRSEFRIDQRVELDVQTGTDQSSVSAPLLGPASTATRSQ